MQHGDVQIGHIESRGLPTEQVLIVATVPLSARPEASADGIVEVPDEPRRRAEEALEHGANLLSVVTGGSRYLSSPSLPVAFRAENTEEREWLQQQKQLADADQGVARPNFTVRLDEDHATALSDRLDGVSLLAEALANGHLTGRFHELQRVFERAFGESG